MNEPDYRPINRIEMMDILLAEFATYRGEYDLALEKYQYYMKILDIDNDLFH